jgi:hypothetical protein
MDDATRTRLRVAALRSLRKTWLVRLLFQTAWISSFLLAFALVLLAGLSKWAVIFCAAGVLVGAVGVISDVRAYVKNRRRLQEAMSRRDAGDVPSAPG